MNKKWTGVVAAILGVGALSLALFSAELRFAAIAMAMGSFFYAATVLSKANQIAKSLAPWVNRAVRVEVWGVALEGADAGLEVKSISAVSAGLHIHLRAAGRSARDLKVAQPGAAKIEAGRVEIKDAAYVSWGGVKIKRGAGPAVVLTSSGEV